MPVTVRLLAESEWPLWRDVTLRSLADSPDAFRTTFAESKAQPDEFWRDTVASTIEDASCHLWIAVTGRSGGPRAPLTSTARRTASAIVKPMASATRSMRRRWSSVR